MAGLLDTYLERMIGPQTRGLLDRFRGVDPATGETDYWKRGGLAGLLGMPSALEQSPEDIAMGFAGSITPAKGAALLKATQPIRAYHGSPHDFDKFDLSKIGTGEGAQAYGHGLYFAGNEGVARSYRDALAKPAIEVEGQKLVPARKTPEEIALSHLDNAIAMQSSSPWAAARENIRKLLKYEQPAALSGDMNDALKILDRWQESGAKPTNTGRMYEVNIHADPERFLDWDKPLSGQSDVLDRLNISGSLKTADMPAQSAIQAAYKNRYRAADLLQGGQGELGPLTPVELSSRLKDAGIPGIKYLDQGSRSSGAGTSNYVVFDDKLIEILRKYGIAGLLGGGAAAGSGEAMAAQ